MARHFFDFEPRKLPFTNGQQTLGAGGPCAMAASLINLDKNVAQSSGKEASSTPPPRNWNSGSAEAQKSPPLSFRDGGDNMVAFQQELHYGCTSGTDFGNPDFVKYAESLGCIGLRVSSLDENQELR